MFTGAIENVIMICRRALPFLFNDRTPAPASIPGAIAPEAEMMLDRNQVVVVAGGRASRQETVDRDSDRHFGLLTEMWKK